MKEKAIPISPPTIEKASMIVSTFLSVTLKFSSKSISTEKSLHSASRSRVPT